MPVGQYLRSFFKQSRSSANELVQMDHSHLSSLLGKTERRCIVLYHWHPRIPDLFSSFEIQMIDASGLPTTNPENCEEIIVTNF